MLRSRPEAGLPDEDLITAARRTAIGSFLGAFADVPAVTLGTTVARKVLVHALHSRQRTHGVDSLCMGGGMDSAVVLRNADAG